MNATAGPPVNGDVAGERSGPAVALLYQRSLAAIFLIAWLSLGVQVDGLIGSRGLLPAASLLATAAGHGVGFAELPTLFWLNAGDAALHAGIWIGAALSIAALLGIWPRVCIAFATALYLSYATACGPFLSFQWDNLLLECGLLAIFLPTDRPAPWAHVLFRLLLFKLYWESGLAKWQSPAGDWQDGSAMTFYYETAPLPAWPAWYAHHLPIWWHHLESWGTLVIELVVPLFIFGPRVLRLLCCAVFTAFQLTNLVTANYGFFVYLALGLHLFLLGDRDVERVLAWLPARRQRRSLAPGIAAWERGLRIAGAATVVAVVVGISVLDAVAVFAPMPVSWQRQLAPLMAIYEPWRLINTYHLFGHITQERIEPEFQVQEAGTWRAFDLHHKPGEVRRAPDFVAPHQPRVDFQLWFYGLSFQRGTPAYVRALLDKLCDDPAAVQDLFTMPLPAHPEAVRIEFWRYHFSAPNEQVAWWTREPIATMASIPCAR